MAVTFPNSSRAIVEGFGREVFIKANYVLDAEYNNQTLQVCCNHNGGNRDISRDEEADNVKHGRIIPLMN